METAGKRTRSFQTQYEHQSKNKITLSHPEYKGRADRLDLITNKMVGMRTAIGDKNYTVCDISQTGFSYAEKVPVKKNLSFKQVKLKVDKIASSNYGKNLKCICYFEGEAERGGVKTTGTIKNHRLFLVLSPDEIKQNVTSYLQSKSIRRSHDPNGYFTKLDMLLGESTSTNNQRCSPVTVGVAMNTTFQNLILEIGAPSDIFDKLYEGYINKPVYVKYGVFISDQKEAADLVKFAVMKNAKQLEREKSKREENLNNKLIAIKRLNQKISFKDFLFSIWKTSLKSFKLDQELALPRIDSEKVALQLKEEKEQFDGRIECIIDPDFANGPITGIETYLCNGLYWHLIELDKKYFDREVIKKEIRGIISSTYECFLNLEMIEIKKINPN